MSTFPIIYKPQDNSTITKYYQVVPAGVDAPPDPHLEREILLNHMLRQQTSRIENITGEVTDFNNNLIISDVNSSINNPTAFCFSSTYVEIPPATENYVYNPIVGVNNFKDITDNELTSKIQLDELNSPIFDTDLLIKVTDGDKLFNNHGDSLKWTAKFGDNNNQLLQLANNSGYYGGIPPLNIEEDTSFNINCALGKLQNYYYTENEISLKLNSHALDLQNLLSTNNITVDVYKDYLNNFSFGTYKIEQLESTLEVQYKNINNTNTSNLISNNYIITGENDEVFLSSINTLSKYTDLTLDHTENNSVKIKITKIEPNSGLNFDNIIYNEYFTFDNSTMVNNNDFMKKIIYSNAQMQIEINQTPMTITPVNDYFSDSSLSANGETLTDVQYNEDGKIILQVVPNNERYTVSESSSNNYKEINVNYSNLSDNLKINNSVEYTITNLVGPTTAYLDSVANNMEDNSGLFTAPNLSNYNNFQLTNSRIKELIDPNDENIVIIKVNPLTTYTFDNDNNYLYILNSNDNVPDEVTSVKIQISISGNNINPLLSYDDLRFNISPRKVSDVFLDTAYYNVSEHNLLKESNTSNTNLWTIGYSDDNNYLTTSLLTSSRTYNSNKPEPQQFIVNFYMSLEQYGPVSIYTEEFMFLDPLYINTIPIKSKTNWYKKEVENAPNTTSFFKVSGSKYNEFNVITKTHVNYVLSVNIGFYENITLKTPTIILIEESKYTYPKFTTSEITNNFTYQISPDSTKIFKVSGQGQSTDVTNNASTNLTKRSFCLNLENTTEITSDNPISFSVNLTRNSSNPVFFNLEGRNKINNGYSNWTLINEKQSINPYFTAFYNVNNESIILTTPNSDYTITLDISFEDYFKFDKTYFLPLSLNNDSAIKSTIITGYKYGIYNLKDPNFNEEYFQYFNPHFFVPNPLLPFGINITENLDFDITYNTTDPTQGNEATKATMIIKYNSDIVAQIDIDSPIFNSPIILCRNTKYLFSVNRIINNDTENKLHYRLFGENNVDNAYKGTITMYNDENNTVQDGVLVNYEEIQIFDSINFILNSDKISVQLVGTDSLEPTSIDKLEYNQEGSETLSIPYYRGYTFEEISQELGSTHTYTINRQNLVSYKITATDESSETIYSSDTNKPYSNSTYTIVFDNGVGSVGTTITPLFSRLPTNMLENTSLNIQMKVTSDEITITRTIFGNDTVEIKMLQDYDLHTFENGKKLKALKLNASPNSILNDYYSLKYKKSDTKISYSNKYIGNPLNISSFSNEFQFAFSDAKLGVHFNDEGSTNNGFLKLTVTNETIPGTTSYLVVAPPYLAVSQMGVDILRTLQNIQTNDIDISKKVKKYFPVKSENQSTKYNPFTGEKTLIGTEWVNTLQNYIFNNDNDFKQEYNPISSVSHYYHPQQYQFQPSVTALSGNGEVFYTSISINDYTTLTVRSSYVDNEWVKEYFAYNVYNPASYGITNTASLKFKFTDHYIPVATSYDGNTVILTKTNFEKCQVVSYSNGSLQKMGNEIPFVRQSNFNLNSRTNRLDTFRYHISSDGLKIVLIAAGGMNTLVFNSETNNWDLLPASSDIKQSHFVIKDWATTALYDKVSENGMWMVLINDLNPTNNSTYNFEMNVFKFDTNVNNWVFFKSIPNNNYRRLYIANNGDIVAQGYQVISRYAYDNVTQEYILQASTPNGMVRVIDMHDIAKFTLCTSADCNTVFFQDVNGSDPTSQMIRKINFINNEWVREELPISVFPFYKSSTGSPGFWFINRVCLCSNDGTTLLTSGANPALVDNVANYAGEDFSTNNIYKFKSIYQSELDAPLNDITFTQKFTKTYKEYETDPAVPITFDITGSIIEIKEVLPLVDTQTDNGPDNDGVIFKGSITELLDMPTNHKYYNFIKLNQSVTNITHLMLSYTQKYNGVSFYSPAQPTNNIHFNIDGFFISNGTYRLNSSTDKASKLSIYDMIKRQNDIVLLKYDCEAIDYTNIPKDTMIHEINFIPTKVYKSHVQMPVRTFGEKYSDVFNSINQTKMTLSNDDIVWSELPTNESNVLLERFSLKISAVNNDGLKNIIECLYTTNEIVKNFTVIRQTNALEILATDNTPLMIISPFGQISTSKLNTKELTFFANISNNVELFEQVEISN